MKFSLNTDHVEDIEVQLSNTECEKDRIFAVNEFCRGITYFFLAFLSVIDCDVEKVKEFKKLCLHLIEKRIDRVLEQDFSSFAEEGLKDFAVEMKEAGFDESIIEATMLLLKECGSITEVTDILEMFGDAGSYN